MEEIYLKNLNEDWYSVKVDLKSYFDLYGDLYKKVLKRNNISLLNVIESILGEENFNQIEKKEITKLIEEISNLKTRFKSVLPSPDTSSTRKDQQSKKSKTVEVNKKSLKGLQPGTSLQNSHDYFGSTEENNVSKENKNSNVKKQVQMKSVNCKTTKKNKSGAKNLLPSGARLNILKFRENMRTAKYKKHVLTPRGELILDKEFDKSNKKNLKCGKDFVVSFRIHEPFTQSEGKGVKPLQQEILLLGRQTLDELRDKIVCQADFQDVRGDVSNDPDSLATVLTRDKYKSAMFYFDNTFYVDERGDQDYSEVVRQWALPRGINVGVTRNMGTTRVSDLQLRFGYPYLYKHQGSCEHLVVISDARLLTGTDSLDSTDYPLLSRIHRPMKTYCFVCFKMPARWIVVGCERLPQNISYMCEGCFKSYNYINKKKIGNFKAYRYFSKNLLL